MSASRTHPNTNRAAMTLGIAALALGLAAPAVAAPPDPTIRLNNQQETTDATGRGTGTFTWSIDGSELCYTLTVKNLTTAPFAAHLHPGARKVAGPAAVGLLTPPGATSSSSGCITAVEGATGQALSTEELASIRDDARSWYVNVHTTTFPGGEIRGQLR